METIVRYKCMYCATEYSTSESCKKCEDSHKLDYQVVGRAYQRILPRGFGTPPCQRPAGANDGSYPANLILHFDGDDVAKFVRYVYDASFSDNDMATMLHEGDDPEEGETP